MGLGYVAEPAVVRVIEPLLIHVGNLTGFGFLTSETLAHSISFALAFTLITFLHIVFGELAPKTIAFELSERVSMMIALPLQIFYKIFYYPIRVLDWTGVKTVRLFGLRPTGGHGSIYTEDEIRQLVRISQESGHLNEEERKLINQVFEFSETTVREAMIPRTEIVALSRNDAALRNRRVFREHGYSRIPVYRESLDDIAGVIHSKDVMISMLSPDGFRIEQNPSKTRICC